MATQNLPNIDKDIDRLGEIVSALNKSFIRAAGLWENFLEQVEPLKRRGAFDDYFN